MPAATTRSRPVKPLYVIVPAVVLAVLLGAFLVGRAVTSGNAPSDARNAGTDTARAGATGDPTSGDNGAAASQLPGSAAAAAESSITVGGEDLLAAADGSLERFIGKEAIGAHVRVLELATDNLVWVGNGPRAEVLLSITPEDPSQASTSALAVGSIIEFSGVVRALPQEADRAQTFGLRDTKQLDIQRAYIVATSFVQKGINAAPSD